jgi:hypothetical protein
MIDGASTKRRIEPKEAREAWARENADGRHFEKQPAGVSR